MREIFIKNDPLKEFWTVEPVQYFLSSLDKDKALANKQLVDHNLAGVVPHASFGEYLKLAYMNDYGIVIRPEFFWHTVMQQLAGHVQGNADLYREFFTKKKKGKTTITGYGTDFIHLPVMDILNRLLPKIPSFPTDIGGKKLTPKQKREVILPPFSTATDESKICTAAAFLEAASEYYIFHYYGCVYNKIKIYGTPEDFGLMYKTVNHYLSRMFPPLTDYWNQLQKALGRIQSNWNNDEFWKRILWTEQGYMQQNVDGWYVDFFIAKEQNMKFNYMPFGGYSGSLGGYTKVEYKELVTQRNYAMITGLLSSTIEDGYMVPHFEQIVMSLDDEAAEKRVDAQGYPIKK